MYPTRFGRCTLALLIALTLSSASAFFAPRTSSSMVAQRLWQRGGSRNHQFMKAIEHDTNNKAFDALATIRASSAASASSSRKSFIERGALATIGGFAIASTAPVVSEAAQFGGVEVRGIDVAEVLHPGAGGTGKASKPLRDCLLNVERVRISTKQLEDTLTNEGPPPGLTGLVKGLVKNYKLDESLRQGALYIESQGDRNAAASAGREALEYLAQTIEYFPVELDERTGAPKRPSVEALEFTINALGATRGKLDLYLSKIPSDALREARAEIKAEGGDS